MVTGDTRSESGLALADRDFRARANAFLRERLRLLYGWLAVFGAALYVLATFMFAYVRGWGTYLWTELPRVVHVVVVAGLAFVYFLLRRRNVRARALVLLDALGLQVILAGFLVAYAYRYADGFQKLPALMALCIIGRAVAVPCSARTTLLLSLPAPLGLLAVQFVLGTGFATKGVPYAPDRWVFEMVLDQVILVVAVAAAATASHVNFGLRLQVRKTKDLAQYHLDELIGQGGMGTVFRGTHAMLRRPTAIKLLSPEDLGEEKVKRFEREVRQTCRLSHPNTVAIYDYGRTAEGLFYYAMEYIDGADLRVVVQKTGAMPPARAIHVLRQACGALREAHGLGLVHRDIKPSNLMLCRRGGEPDVVKVVDFGLVKDVDSADPELTAAGALYGSPETISPEMLRDGKASPSSDLYALGVVGYWMLTGQRIFDSDHASQLIMNHMLHDPVPLHDRDSSIPGDLEAAIMRCLNKEPAERHAGVAGFDEALAACRDAGRWTRAEAAAWWDEHGEEVRPEGATSADRPIR